MVSLVFPKPPKSNLTFLVGMVKINYLKVIKELVVIIEEEFKIGVKTFLHL